MRAVAGWITARPWNAVLALALTLQLPFSQVLSGAVMVLLVLAAGLRTAVLEALAAGLVLAGLLMLFGTPPLMLAVTAIVAWLPAVVMAGILRQTRSVTLTLQLSVILALLGTLGFFIAVADPQAFWLTQLEQIATMFAESGLTQQAELIRGTREMIAPQMTMLFVATSWSIVALVTVLGLTLYQQLPDKRGACGRFCDLNFGRVLAVMMAIASLAALAIAASWLQNLAFVLFAVFWVQGLALVHWLHSDGPLPMLAVVAVYVLLPFLNALLVIGLAVLGYSDAWFDYRSRIIAARKARGRGDDET